MNINRLGNLTEHPDIPEWLVSKPVAVPYFDGLELTFTLDGLEEMDELEVNAAIDSFLMLTSADRLSASSHVFKNYRRILDIADEEDLGCTITTEFDVWKHVRPSEVFVSRRSRRDRLIYIQIAASCDWEREHGLQIIYRQGMQLSRVSDQDGHLTYSDAFDVPEDQDRIS
ncbi:MAG: hypothetical protein HQ518_02460 [Rhodopirellula sp.]|nr:hypothetical protein [Rhodopirellula sp.]